ncbi:uncharacterized protein [Amphiura filiformis]|uniref:uncharacterized protein n=1 Tax=Amphiura filiformis TaxID=82378 RepID=UPI003B212613
MTENLPGNLTSSLIKRKSLGLSRRKRFISAPNQPSKDDQDTDSSSSSNFHSPKTVCRKSDLNMGINEKVTARTTYLNKFDKQMINCITPNSRACSSSETMPKKSCKSKLDTSRFSSSSPSDYAAGTMTTCSQSPSSTPISRPRMGLHRSGRKRFKMDIKYPIHGTVKGEEPSKDDDEEIEVDIESLQQESSRLAQEINALKTEGLEEAELQIHMRKMHEYNELKDMGQMLLGKIAFIEGVTTKDLYNKYGLDLED